MKIHEYQAKEILSSFGVAIPKGRVAGAPEEARRIAEELGGKAVIKAQVHAGGRGKAGGVKVAGSPQEAEQFASTLIGSRLVTPQTGPQGVPVSKVLVEEAMEIEKELYVGILIDATAGGEVVMASEAGGMEIEEVAASAPEKILRATVDPVVRFQPFQGRRLAYGMGLKPELVRPAATLVQDLCRVFEANDCSLLEINPLVATADGRLLCLDAKITLEDDAMFRHRELGSFHDAEQEDELETRAAQYDIQYIRLDGDVGCMVNGAGLAMATMDATRVAGTDPANFCDVGGGADEEKIAQAFKVVLADPNVSRVLINVFGGILRCDVLARGVAQVAEERQVNLPVVARLLGTNAEEGKEILSNSRLNVSFANNLAEAAEKLREVGGPCEHSG